MSGGLSFREVWAQLVRKQPRLESPDTKIEFTSASLEALLRQVYEQGAKQQDRGRGGIGGGMFDDIWGKKP